MCQRFFSNNPHDKTNKQTNNPSMGQYLTFCRRIFDDCVLCSWRFGCRHSRHLRSWRTNMWTQRGTGQSWAEWHSLVTKIVSSRLATIIARHNDRNTSKTTGTHHTNAFSKPAVENTTSLGSADPTIDGELTGERDGVPGDGQQVVHVEHESGVAQDERHLKLGAFDSLWRQQEAEEIQCDEEKAGVEEVDHVQGGPALQRQLQWCGHTATSKGNSSFISWNVPH